jgi:hypothetical protein
MWRCSSFGTVGQANDERLARTGRLAGTGRLRDFAVRERAGIGGGGLFDTERGYPRGRPGSAPFDPPMSPTGTRKPAPSRRLLSAAPLIAVALLVVAGILVSIVRSDGDEPPAGAGAGQQGEHVADPTLTLARDLSIRLAEPWPGVQKKEGRYRSAVGGGTRYGDALLSYALLNHGLRENNKRLVDSGLKGLTFAVPRLGTHSRASIFEALGIVGSYKLLRDKLPDDPTFKRLRPRMEWYLRGFELVRLPATTYYGNHWLIEAVLVQELLTTDLRSKERHAVLGGERQRAAKLSADLFNKRIPAMARKRGVTVGGERTFVLSDPPDDPLAYQGLSLGFYARGIQLLGKRASRAARQTLIEVANASLWIAAPDGDLAYFGRNQEQVWALGGTAYGAEVAAGLPESGAAQEGRYRALAARALERIRDVHGISRWGVNITPGVRAGRHAAEKGLDGGAGGPSFGGLTQLFVDWSLPEIADAAHRPTRTRADVPGAALLSRGDSRFAVVRTKNVWYAVRTSRGGKHPEELRDDFGLMALKIRGANGDWRDVVRLRPITRGEGNPTQSAGPVLMRDAGLRAFPFTERAGVRRDGTVVLTGGLRGSPSPFKRVVARLDNGTIVRALDFSPGTLIRSGMSFRFQPTRCGVQMEVAAQAGDTFEYSMFLAGDGKPPTVTARGVEDANARWTFNRPARVKLERGYASAFDPKLVRARATFASLPGGTLRIAVCGKPGGG